MNREERTRAFRELARTLTGVDVAVYRQFEKDPLQPIIGEGDPRARLAFFGRDPGRDEVRHDTPFIGAGGQKVRTAVYETLHARPMPGFEASLEVGRYLFWANTVPYKPAGNKAWPGRVKQRFFPLMADLLLREWRGVDVLTLGREAFLWFCIGASKEGRQRIEEHWRREDRFQTSLEVELKTTELPGRALRLHPLPHPSPLNAAWYARFPDLLKERLKQLRFSLEGWQIGSDGRGIV